MSGGRQLLNALSEHPATADDVSNFRLVAVDFHSARPKEVGGRVQVEELCVHLFPFKCWNGELVLSLVTTIDGQQSLKPLPSYCEPKRLLDQARARHFSFHGDALFDAEVAEGFVQRPSVDSF